MRYPVPPFKLGWAIISAEPAHALGGLLDSSIAPGTFMRVVRDKLTWHGEDTRVLYHPHLWSIHLGPGGNAGENALLGPLDEIPRDFSTSAEE